MIVPDPERCGDGEQGLREPEKIGSDTWCEGWQEPGRHMAAENNRALFCQMKFPWDDESQLAADGWCVHVPGVGGHEGPVHILGAHAICQRCPGESSRDGDCLRSHPADATDAARCDSLCQRKGVSVQTVVQ